MNEIERRQFIRQVFFGSIGLKLGASSIPTFLSNSLLAQATGSGSEPSMMDAGKGHKILVLLQLEGGNDGLNTVIPWEDKRYYDARKTIGIKEADVHKIAPIKRVVEKREETSKSKGEVKEGYKGSALGLHPEMTFFAEMYAEGKLAVLTNVGYENPNRSHFKSGAIWQSGLEGLGMLSEGEIENETGWLGRYFDAQCAGENNFVGAYYGDSPLVMRGVAFSGTSITDIGREAFGFMKLKDDFAQSNIFKMLQEKDMGNTAGDNNKASFLRNVASETQRASDDMRRYLADAKSDGYYPDTKLGNQFKTISEFILRGSSTRVYLARIGGFDTHSNQTAGHARLWKEINGALSVFMKQMGEAKLDGKVAVMTFSEFGRQVKENGTNGTDHGSAAPMFIMGGGVEPGIYGNAPLLKKSEMTGFGGLAYETDFRRVYRSIIEQYLDAPSKGIIADIHEPLALFKSMD